MTDLWGTPSCIILARSNFSKKAVKGCYKKVRVNFSDAPIISIRMTGAADENRADAARFRQAFLRILHLFPTDLPLWRCGAATRAPPPLTPLKPLPPPPPSLTCPGHFLSPPLAMDPPSPDHVSPSYAHKHTHTKSPSFLLPPCTPVCSTAGTKQTHNCTVLFSLHVM